VVKGSSKRVRALLENAQLASSSGEQVTLTAPPALVPMLAEKSSAELVAAAFQKVIGGSWKITVTADAAGAPSPGRQQPRDPEPDPRDEPDYDAPAGSEAAPAADPEAEALRLLQDQLGARPVGE